SSFPGPTSFRLSTSRSAAHTPTRRPWMPTAAPAAPRRPTRWSGSSTVSPTRSGWTRPSSAARTSSRPTPSRSTRSAASRPTAADELGISPNDIEVRHGDTFESPGMGVGTFGSRSLAVGGIAVHKAAEKVREKVIQIGAHLLEASPDDVVVEGGKVFVKGVPDKAKNFGDISMAAYLASNLPEGMEPGLEATVYYDPPNFTFPFVTPIAEVEIDGETGAVRLVNYSACDDCGRQINPMIVEGQLPGGIPQGIGQALYETAIY